MKNGVVAAITAMGLAVPAVAAVPVTVENFKRAESELYLQRYADMGALGAVLHDRAPPPASNQPVIRMNRDTLYSYIVLDLASPATVIKPSTGARFQSMIVIDQDHYIKRVEYGGGRFELTQDNVGSRYAVVLFRTFLDPNDPKDVKAAHAAQNGIRLMQANRGRFEPTGFDEAQRERMHDLLNQLAPFAPDVTAAFGDTGEVDPVQHLIMTSAGWGAMPGRTRST